MASGSEVSNCVICRHKDVAAIDAAQDAGDTILEIAQRFGVTKVALRKHAAHKASPSASAPETAPSPLTNVVQLHPCPVCRHDKRSAIEAALGAGNSWAQVGRVFYLDAKEVRQHATTCLKDAFKRSGGADAAGNARVRLLALVETVEQLIHDVTHDDEASYSDKAKLLGAGHRIIESLGRFTGELALTIDESRIVASPAWKRIETALAAALAPFPEAAAAVAKVLEELETA